MPQRVLRPSAIIGSWQALLKLSETPNHPNGPNSASKCPKYHSQNVLRVAEFRQKNPIGPQWKHPTPKAPDPQRAPRRKALQPPRAASTEGGVSNRKPGRFKGPLWCGAEVPGDVLIGDSGFALHGLTTLAPHRGGRVGGQAPQDLR